jgi:hypothetical protein
MTDASEIVELHNRYYHDSRGPEHWLWAHGSDPDKLNVFTIAKNGAKVIATLGRIPIYLNIAGRIRLTAKTENVLVDPAFRGEALFSKLNEYSLNLCKQNNMQFIWGFTTATKVFRRFGDRIPQNNISSNVAVLNIPVSLRYTWSSNKSIKEKAIRSVQFVAMGILFRLKLLFAPMHQDQYIILPQSKSPEDIIRMYDRIRTKYENLISIHVSEPYLAWRIRNNPFIKYKSYYLYEGEDLRAYAFLNVQNGFCSYLTDFTFEHRKWGEQLLSRIIRDLQKYKFGLVVFWGNSSNSLCQQTISLLKSFGFLGRKEPIHLMVRNLLLKFTEEEVLLNPEVWYINGLWTEGSSI